MCKVHLNMVSFGDMVLLCFLEASGNFGYYDLDANSGLAGGVDVNGIPIVVSPSGQSNTAAVTNNAIRSGCPNTVITNRRITIG